MNRIFCIIGSRTLFCGLFILVCAMGIGSCKRQSQASYTPKPDGYFRIDPYPEEYRRVSIRELSIEITEQAETILTNDSTQADVQWLNVRFPRYRATIYCSLHPLRNNLERLNAESRELVYRQSIHPDWVQAVAYADTVRHIYATFYDLTAESATPLQFVVTDSTRYLLRGALYYDAQGRSDSLAPDIDDLSNHIFHLIESIEPAQ